MSWNDSNSDDMPIEARSERCTPEKYWTAPRGPVPMDDLLEYINSPIMGHLRRFYDHVFLFLIDGDCFSWLRFPTPIMKIDNVDSQCRC